MRRTKEWLGALACVAAVVSLAGYQAVRGAEPAEEKEKSAQAQAAEASVVRDGVFIHVSRGSEDPHRVAMALKMAELMAGTRDVLVYFDIRGVEVVLKDSKDIAYAQFPSSHTQLKALLEKGVELRVCPGCLQAAGKTPEDVLEGIELANPDIFFDFTKGRILTIDY